MIFAREYLRILIPLVIAFAIYHLFAVPYFEPNHSTASTPQWEHKSIEKTENWWDSFFQPEDWQRKSCRMVKTDTAILLFQNSTQKTETRWHVKPLTIIVQQGESGGKKRAMFINNAEGMEIQFKSEVDWTKELPPLESGQMLGNIVITSPPDDPLQDNGLRLEASDLRIDHRQIWSTNEIRMQLGNSIVEGKNLMIELDKDLLTEEEPGVKSETPFNGLNSLELVYVNRVHVGLNPGGLWPNDKIPDMERRPAYATLKCDGSFFFDFHQSKATLKNGVHMEHIVQGMPLDTFDCHELKLRIGWGNKSELATAPGLQSGKSNWSIEHIEAIGEAGRDTKDRTRWLKLAAPGMNAEAYGQHLVMDLVNGEVTLSNSLPGMLQKESSFAYLRREAVQVWAPEVQYRNAQAIANANSNSNANDTQQRIGAVLASGAGRAQMDNNGESWVLSWGKRLLIRDAEDKDVVLIEGSANIFSPTHGRFVAETLKLWLTPMTKDLSNQMASSFQNGDVPFALPDRMEADGEVIVDSPELKARVEKMQVWFAYQNPDPSTINSNAVSGANPALTAASSPAGQNTLQSPTTNVGFQGPQTPSGNSLQLNSPVGLPPAPLMQPMQSVRNSPVNGKQPAAPTSPMNVTARTLQARVMRVGMQTHIDDLQLDGNFTLTKDQVSDTSPWPFTVTGDRLRLTQRSSEASDISIVGQPAKVAVGSGWVIAQELQLKQSENQFWIDHPGELVIPVEAMQQNMTQPSIGTNSLVSLPSGLNAANAFRGAGNPNLPNFDNGVKWREAPRLQWGQRMTFDGRTARFGGGVTINCRMETDVATLWHVDARADRMSVDMDQPVSMRSNGSTPSAKQPQIAVIRLEENVDIRAVQTDQRLNRRSMEHMKLPQLDILVPSQSWIGHGPGELWSRRIGNANPLSTVTPTTQETDGQKQCIHLSFVGRMEGVLSQRSATFYDRIQALLGPIADWEDSINVHRVDRLGRNQTLLISDQLGIFDASALSDYRQSSPDQSRNSAWEVKAMSRVSMQSNTEQGLVTVTADSLSYGAKNDVVRLERSPNKAATIYRTQPNSNEPDINVQVSNASMRLKTGEFDMRLTKIEGNIQSLTQPVAQQPTNGAPAVQPPRSFSGNNGVIPSARDTPLFPSPR